MSEDVGGSGFSFRQVADELTRSIGGKEALIGALKEENYLGWVEGMTAIIDGSEQTVLSIPQLMLFYHTWALAAHAESIDAFAAQKPEWWHRGRDIIFGRQDLRIKEARDGETIFRKTDKKYPVTDHVGLRQSSFRRGDFVGSEVIQGQVLERAGLDPSKEYVVLISGVKKSS